MTMQWEKTFCVRVVNALFVSDSSLNSVEKLPRTLDLGEGESGWVSFIFRPASNASNGNVTGLAMITPRLTTETGMKLRGCPIIQRIYQQHVRENY